MENDDWENIYYLLMTDEAGREHKFRKRGPVILAPGRYKVALRLTEHNHSEASFGEIVVGETGFVDAQLTSGIKFNTKIEGEIAIFAVNLESGEEAKIHWSRSSSNPWPAMPLGAGRYRFDIADQGIEADDDCTRNRNQAGPVHYGEHVTICRHAGCITLQPGVFAIVQRCSTPLTMLSEADLVEALGPVFRQQRRVEQIGAGRGFVALVGPT